ncbi:MAG: hypothetical protein P8Z33_13190 [Gammaproteobacteria bacterium]
MTPFLSKLGNVSKVPIVSCAVAYDDPRDYSTYVLIFHQVLYFADDLENNLLCPNQLRMNGIHVYECPRLMDPNPTEHSHSIVIPCEDLTIPLELDGVISYFPTRKPTRDELDSCYHIEMTPEAPSWDPYAPSFSQEESAVYHATDLNEYAIERGSRTLCAVSATLASVSIALCEDEYISALQGTVRVAAYATCFVKASKTGKRKSVTMPEHLARIWHIGLDAAK